MHSSPRSLLSTFHCAHLTLTQSHLPDLYGACLRLETMPSRRRAALGQELLAILKELRVAHVRMIVASQKLLELLLPHDKRQRPQVLTVELHEVEAPGAEDLLGVVAGVQRPAIRRAVSPACHDLSVDDGAPTGQRQQRVVDAGEAVREVASVLGEIDGLFAAFMRLAAITVSCSQASPLGGRIRSASWAGTMKGQVRSTGYS